MEKQETYLQIILNRYPDLEIRAAHLKQGGQFNDILIVNDEIIFRFPKSEREAAKLPVETALLRLLRDRVEIPIPNPVYESKAGQPPGRIFMGYHLLPGEPLWPETLHTLKDEQVIQHLADQLATFLRQMHTISSEVIDIQLPAFSGCEEWRDLYHRFRDKLFPFMRSDACQWVTRRFETFLNDERNCNYEPALIHGDFGPSNILYDAGTQSISGIIDFSSAGWGDPAVDFAAILCSVSYGESFLQRFEATYPGIEAILTRSRFYADTFALQEALYGLEDGDEEAFERGIVDYR